MSEPSAIALMFDPSKWTVGRMNLSSRYSETYVGV